MAIPSNLATELPVSKTKEYLPGLGLMVKFFSIFKKEESEEKDELKMASKATEFDAKLVLNLFSFKVILPS